MLAAALFLVLALGAWLDQPRELVSPSGIIQGASYADVHARMPAALALTVAALVGAVLAAATRIGRSHAALLVGGRRSTCVVLLGGEGYAAVLQRFVVAPERAGARDAVHRTQHRGDARRRSRSTASRSAS